MIYETLSVNNITASILRADAINLSRMQSFVPAQSIQQVLYSTEEAEKWQSEQIAFRDAVTHTPGTNRQKLLERSIDKSRKRVTNRKKLLGCSLDRRRKESSK